MTFKQFKLKFTGMRKEQDFLIYPYSGGDDVLLQSDTRICRLNLKTGETLLSKAHSNGSYGHDLHPFRGAYFVQIDQSKLIEIQGYLWNNAGITTDNAVLSIENKELFSN